VTVGTLPLTGERTVPGVAVENYFFRRHEVVYAACPRWYAAAAGPAAPSRERPVAPRSVLDAGCGEGYGAGILAGAGPSTVVVGLDYDAASVAHAAATYGGSRTAYIRGALTTLPLPDAGVDLVVSLQVLEHLWSPGDYVGELVRVTRPGGVVVLSTPNRLTFSPGLRRRERPVNPFHSREYDPAELTDVLARWAPQCRLAALVGVRHGPRLRAWERSHGPVVRAQLAAPPDRWPAELAALVTGVGRDDFELTGDDLDHSLDLVAALATAAD
jgi:SAM-dependent methyltransferase